MPRNRGALIIIGSVTITAALWLLSKKTPGVILSSPLYSLSQISALIGLLLVMANLVLSTRLKWVEDLWGGLDKAYESHHILGMSAFILLVNHPLLMAVQTLPNVTAVKQYLLPGAFLPYNAGIFALYLMLAAFVFMLVVKLPYHLWKRTHQILGFAALLGGTHALLIASDISVFMPLRIWMALWIGLGTLSFVYTFFLYNTVGGVFAYEVVKTERNLDVITVTAKPVRRKMEYRPGQFAYVAFDNPSVGREQHPFTIASSPQEDTLRFSIKMLGDYTVRLSRLREGDRMFLKGPHGSFGNRFIAGNQPLVWVAGGIGITPFLSMLRGAHNGMPVRLYYCYGTKEEGIFSSELKRLASRHANVKIVDWVSRDKGRFSVSRISNDLADLQGYAVQLCGPPPMMDSLRKQFAQIGVPEEKILYENFELI